MTRRYTLAQSPDSANIADQISDLSTHPNWEPFMNWLYRLACLPSITLNDPNPYTAVAQQGRMNLFMSIIHKLEESKRGKA